MELPTSFPLSDSNASGVPSLQNTCSNSTRGTVEASLFGNGKASVHLVKISVQVEMYTGPQGVLNVGLSNQSTFVQKGRQPVSVVKASPC